MALNAAKLVDATKPDGWIVLSGELAQEAEGLAGFVRSGSPRPDNPGDSVWFVGRLQGRRVYTDLRFHVEAFAFRTDDGIVYNSPTGAGFVTLSEEQAKELASTGKVTEAPDQPNLF